ncbi:cytokine receptor family member B16 [Alosa sapidissima]|uniref:cytokine receptor family member B16 n=1 Tax=Alosa sapidissima TaxID=34773 RepID=UPI001C08180B|nr:cytokine receptor family member B16 [Alosa sapidissima]
MLPENDVISKLLLLVLHITINSASRPSAPWNVTMESVNMRHLLRWSPSRAYCYDPHYSVQFQGEWELLFKNGAWEEAMECQHTLRPECDLTSDLASDSDYNIRVRAECNGHNSEWTALNTTFNRRNTIIAIIMDVEVTGDAVHVYISPRSLTMTVTLTMWEEEEDYDTTKKVVDVQHLSHTFPGLRQGATYCLQAKAEVEGSHQTTSTGIQCVSIPSPQWPWQIPVVVTSVLAVTIALACLLGWATKHRRLVVQNTCFHKEPLPSVLVDVWPVTIPMLVEPHESLGGTITIPALSAKS